MIWAFGDCVADEDLFELRRDGRALPVPSKPLRLLFYLVRNSHRVVPSGELLRELWPGIVVTEHSLWRAARDLRLALGDDHRGCLQCVRGYGYRLVVAFDADGGARSAAVV